MRRFAEMNREQLRAAAADALVVLPIGATEQHGPHLPTGTDWFTIQAVAEESARIASAEIPVIVTPALPFGSSDHHLQFGGTLSLHTETYYRVLRELVESLVTDGFRRIFLLNGHGGNHEVAELAARDVALQREANVGAGSYWWMAWDGLVAAGGHLGRRLPGHAGDFETSMMLALRPDLAPGPLPHRDNPGDTDVRPRVVGWRTELHGFWKEIDGYTDSPDQATAENGQRFFAAITREVAKALVTFYRC
ncbi:MAG: creatininase family protein [Bryobacterales bacterium]|nr:creatininase family protein [Bryobacterales bacterium]